jgi:hypothetical protein
MEDDSIYFERRASEEAIAAAKAQHRKAREAHLQMARSYRDLASGDALR